MLFTIMMMMTFIIFQMIVRIFKLESVFAPDTNLQEEDHKTALHKAAWNCDYMLMQMLLEGGADARAMDINGCAPIQYLLKVTDIRPAALPDRCYQLLLNHCAPRIYPPQFHKVPHTHVHYKTEQNNELMNVNEDLLPPRQVLQSCHDYPAVLEILVNSYERLKPTRKWKAAIPDDCYQVGSVCVPTKNYFIIFDGDDDDDKK